MTHRPQKRLQLWSQRGFCCLVDCSMSHYPVNIYVGKLTFYRWVKTCAVICAWQRCGSGVKLLEGFYVSVSNNSVFAQQVVFSVLSCCDFLRGHCARSLSSHSTSTSGPECVWQHRTKAALKTSLALIPFCALKNYPPGNKGFAFHIYHCLHDKAMQHRSRKYQSGEKKLLLIHSLLRKNQIKPIDLITHRLRMLMVIVKYKCVWKGTDSPKVQISVEMAENVFNL